MAKSNTNPRAFNFIVARLCDNDYGRDIRDGLDAFVNEYAYHKKCDPLECEKFLRIYVASKTCVHHLDWDTETTDAIVEKFRRTVTYLEGIRVTYDDEPPAEDHDGGSAAIDLHTNYSWTF